MRLFNPTCSIAREVGVSKHIPITHLNSPTCFESHHGMLGMVLQCEGVPFDTVSNAVLNQYKQTWHRVLTALDEGSVANAIQSRE